MSKATKLTAVKYIPYTQFSLQPSVRNPEDDERAKKKAAYKRKRKNMARLELKKKELIDKFDPLCIPACQHCLGAISCDNNPDGDL